MATSFSDMMNEPMMYALGDDSSNASASFPMQHDQMMASSVAPVPTNQLHQQYHHYPHMHQQHQQPPPPPVVMPSHGMDAGVASHFLHNNALKQQQQPSSGYMTEHITPAPVVKSQAHPATTVANNNSCGFFMSSTSTATTTPSTTSVAPPLTQGFVYNPTTPSETTTTATSPNSPMDYSMLQYSNTTAAGDQFAMLHQQQQQQQQQQQPEALSSPMMLDYPGFQMTPHSHHQQQDGSNMIPVMYHHHQQQHTMYQQAPALPQGTIASYTPIVPSNAKVPMVSPQSASHQQSMMDMLMMAESNNSNSGILHTTSGVAVPCLTATTSAVEHSSNIKTVSRRRSTITAKSSPEIQPNSHRETSNSTATKKSSTPSRRTMPRRHTVSGGRPSNFGGNGGKSSMGGSSRESSEEQAKVRKLLKAKRHRSLGKLEMTPPSSSSTASPVLDTSKWRSPETTTTTISSSSSMCSPILSAGSNSDVVFLEHQYHHHHQQEQQMLLLEKLNQQPGADEPPSATAATTSQDEKEETHQCKWESCYLEMGNLEELIVHVKDKHIGSGKALYYCGWENCPRNQKPFTKRHKMHNHLRTHTGERPFECKEPDCGKRFSRPDSLTTHSKIHSNVRPYLCGFENCGKAYYHLRSLRKHERTHEVRYDNNDLGQQQDGSMQQESGGTSVAHASNNPVATNFVPPSGDTALLDWCGTSSTSF